jgi:hypothetical protein
MRTSLWFSTVSMLACGFTNWAAEAAPPKPRTPMAEFYRHAPDPYKYILRTANNDPKNPVAAYVEPIFGVKSKTPVASPTKVATDGLHRLLDGDLKAALAHGQWLVDHSESDDGRKVLWFKHQYDFAPVYPYLLKAPWPSALTQGVALSLFSHLYDRTKDDQWKERAKRIYHSYRVPVAEGGVARFHPTGPFFEEYPCEKPTQVLNGFLLSALALLDYAELCGDASARELFQQSIRHFETIVGEFEIVGPDSPFVLSAYSNARLRPECLVRFAAMTGDVWISKIELLGAADAPVGTVEVGRDEDTERAATAGYVWHDPVHQCWGAAESHEGRHCRNAHGTPKAAYGHAPLSLTLPEASGNGFKVRVEAYLPPGASALFQAYDGKEYHEITRLKGDAEGWRTFEGTLPESVVRATHANAGRRVPDRVYVDDNAALLQAAADASGSARLQRAAKRLGEHWPTVVGDQRWINSNSAQSQGNPFRRFGNGAAVSPTSGGEAIHTEYPSLTRLPGGGYALYYCACGDDLRWRIHRALGDRPEGPWRRDGVVSVEGDGAGNIAFPKVLPTDAGDPSRGVTMYYCSAPAPGKPYANLCRADSKDGVHFTNRRVVCQRQCLDPEVIHDPNGIEYVFYSSAETNGTISLWCIVGNGTGDYTAPRPLDVVTAGYTVAAIPVDAEHALLFFEDRTGLHVARFSFVDKTYSRIGHVTGTIIPGHDYGFDIYRNPSDGKLFVYGNVIDPEGVGDENGGAIWRFHFDPKVLAEFVRTRAAALNRSADPIQSLGEVVPAKAVEASVPAKEIR